MPKCTECEYLGKLENRGSAKGLYHCERVSGGLVPESIIDRDMTCLRYAPKGSVKSDISIINGLKQGKNVFKDALIKAANTFNQITNE